MSSDVTAQQDEQTPETVETPAAETEAPEAVAETAEAPAEAGVPELTLGSGAPEGAGDEPEVEPVIRGKVDKFGVAMGTGRRKTSVARVRIKDGDGKFTVNGRTLEEYFPIERDLKQVLAPLEKTGTLGKVDVWVRVNGGGITGQTGAVVLGIARALHVKDADLHHMLSASGFLTRDPRMVERKKFGFKKARRSFQFSKR